MHKLITKKQITGSTQVITEEARVESYRLATTGEIQKITRKWKMKYKEDLNLDTTTNIREIEELWVTLKKCR
ncbi:hypothetical protein [Bacillus mycoides]|uniref:hypothetical protein n=1 Tax=Bacillus mycoides TaxID=1405 RepID=UPI003D090164